MLIFQSFAEKYLMGEVVRYKAGEALRGRLLEAASRLFSERGYERVSIRQIALEAGCSQMAMYRHFPDKQSLFSHLCVELYRKFTTDLHSRYDDLPDPAERIRMALRGFIELSAENPHHYQLIFLDSTQEPQIRQMRHAASEPNLSFLRGNLRLCLRAGTREAVIEERLHQILALMHGITVMLVVSGASYGLTRATALERFDAGFRILVAAGDAE